MLLMERKRTTVRIDQTLFDEFSNFCDRARVKQEGVIEAAVYYIIHRLPPHQFLLLMQEASDYIATGKVPESAAEASSTDEMSAAERAQFRALTDAAAARAQQRHAESDRANRASPGHKKRATG